MIPLYSSSLNNPHLFYLLHSLNSIMIDINLIVKKATLPKDLNKKHEIDFSIENYQKLNIIDPTNELKIIIQKNDDWNDIITNCKPSFISNKICKYFNWININTKIFNVGELRRQKYNFIDSSFFDSNQIL